MIYIVLAVISGALTILSMIINAALGKKIGVLQGTFINYIAGLVVTIIIILVTKTTVTFNNNLPFYLYLGGAIGVMVVTLSNTVIPKIPVMYTTLLIFIGQIFAGIIIDYYRLGFISKGKVIGGVLIVLGMLYNSNVDKKQLTKTEL